VSASFHELVYAIVRQVPRGRVITYAAIARLLGDPRHARQVGWAMAAAPSRLAAHRVINSRGGVSGLNATRRRKKLEAEGVRFTLDGRVDLERYLWLPDS